VDLILNCEMGAGAVLRLQWWELNCARPPGWRLGERISCPG
jgi:hypothetical protein